MVRLRQMTEKRAALTGSLSLEAKGYIGTIYPLIRYGFRKKCLENPPKNHLTGLIKHVSEIQMQLFYSYASLIRKDIKLFCLFSYKDVQMNDVIFTANIRNVVSCSL